MIKYTDKGTARQHLTDRLMECALNNIGIKADADEVFRDIAENRLPVWIDELQTYDVKEETHGHWVYDKGDRFPKCSVCRQHNGTLYEYRYCPTCGALLDGDVEYA